jgi:uncharacterized membrane protein
MFRTAITTDPKTARRVFVLLVALVLAIVAITAWAIILRDWWLLAIGVIAAADMVATAMKHYTVGWPGSWLDSYRRLPRARLSETQWILAGLVFMVGMTLPLIAFGQAQNNVLLGFVGLVYAVWLFRLVRVIRKEGWRARKERRR